MFDWDWLTQTLPPNTGDLSLQEMCERLAQSLVGGCVVATVYYFSRRRSEVNANPFHVTLVLLTILMAMVTIVIGNSAARAFSLVGALSIVRFRTVVEDTRDTAFVIFAVTIGMAVGAGFLTVALIGTPVIALAVFLFRQSTPNPSHTLVLRVGHEANVQDRLAEVLVKHLSDHRLVATGTARKGEAIEFTYTVRLRDDRTGILPLVAELQKMEGILSVELKR